jgi:parallel beta-helix repeat protein
LLAVFSKNNTVIGNIATANVYSGISLQSSSGYNTVSGNNSTANGLSGIYLYSSSNNTINGNNFAANTWGIYLYSSSNNLICHNNFLGNTAQAATTPGYVNIWDDGYPSGGNYWSDYNGTDLYRGPNQNETASDGIGDTPYPIDGNNRDNYPLMQPWSVHSTRYSWPMFHHDSTHSGYSDSPAPKTNNKLWNYTTGSGVFSSPGVVDGRVYVGSADRRIYCLDASSGAQVWNYTTIDMVQSSPAVADGRVYVGSLDESVYCLDAATGAQIWNYTISNYVDTSPAVVDGRVYVGANDGRVYCLDALTGVQVWNYTTDGSVHSSPAVAGGRVYVGSNDGRVYCLDASSGTQVWNYTTSYDVRSSPVVADGVLYVGSYDCSVYAFGTVLKVPEKYATIQAAINAASPGDTVWIAPGIYHESIIINKTITLIGKPGSEPTFDGGGSGIAITIVPSGSGSTIAGIVITSWDQGILLVNASDCRIYDTIMSLIGHEGITFEGKDAANNRIYSSIFEYNAVGFNLASSSHNNTICNNIVSLSGIGLNIESSGNLVYANIIEQNQLAINMMNSNDNKLYHNNFVSNNIMLSISESTGNVWDDGYPSGGNYWSCHVSNDSYNGPWQNVSGSDGIVDVPYTIATDNIDRYPLLNPFSIHNIGITRFTKSKTVVGQSFPLRLNLTIQNFGMYNETFGLTIYANATILNRQTLDLRTRLSINVYFTWNTTGFTKATYTLSVSADTLAGETESSDNIFCCTIIVSIPGDINGNGVVNILDAINLGNSFLATSGSSSWNPNADINDDNAINILDAIIIGNHFLEHCP